MKYIYRNTGLSLIELMISILLGSILLMGLVATFRTSSDSYRELQKVSDMVENGRYATDLLYNDIHHAGYYGHYYDTEDYPASLPDPCEIANDANLTDALSVPIQGYASAAGITATSCDEKGFFTAADLQAGSDIFVIRRADTDLFAGTTTDATTLVTTGTTTDGEVYIQANVRGADIQIATNVVTVNPLDTTTSAKTADNATPTLKKFPGKSIATRADTRKFRVHTYYVAQCNAAAVCTVADTPTLKRLELGEDGSGNTTIKIVPLVEGVEYFKVQYGIDDTPSTENSTTGSIGDGVPDSYVTTPSTAQFEDVVSIKISLLVRSLEISTNFTDNKSYTVGPLAVAAIGDGYKRSVYSTEIRPNNIAGSREIP